MSAGSAELLAPLRAAADSAGVFADFDGTLARIVDDPAAARPVAGAVEVLSRLARRFARVGVLSGRPVSFLRSYLGGHGLMLSGLYGLESATDDEVIEHGDAGRWRDAVEAVAEATEARGPDGLGVERKGLSVTLHFRVTPEAEEEARVWADAQAAETGLVVIRGRKSFELRPPIDRDKGKALLEAADGLAAACFAGDDRGDLDAFDALDRMEASGAVVVRVGVRSAEAPAELLERADIVVDGPDGAVSFLEGLLEEEP